MLTALNTPEGLLDEREKNFVAKIREHGWFRTNVFAEADHLGFCYTTGFWKTLGLPELIAFSIESDAAHGIFWNIFNDAKVGRQFENGKRCDNILNAHDIVLLPLDTRHYEEYLGWSRWFYGGNSFPCSHMICPDRANLFPWEDGFDTQFASDQPDLSEIWWGGLGN
jgi:hypothetical protein